MPLFFWFNQFLDSRAEILEIISLVFWKKLSFHYKINWPLKKRQVYKQISLITIQIWIRFFMQWHGKKDDFLNCIFINVLSPINRKFQSHLDINKHFFFCCRRSPTQRIYPTFWTCLLPTHHLRRTGSKIGFGASKTKLNPPWWLYRRLTWCRWLWH